jgi:flagellar motor switch protein FliN/FliY
MAETDDKKKEVSGLELNELQDARPATDDNKDDSWDDPPTDIPDKPRSAQDLEAVYDIPVRVSAVLGKSSMQVHELLKLGRGAVVELDRKVGEAIDIYVNDRLVARGEVVVVEDRLGITMTEIIKTQNKG